MALVHALHDQQFLQDNHRVAVVGAGAAGVSAAAAVALLSGATVDLYERGDEVLTLQRASQRRRLDPHIYAWPAPGSTDPAADLPILDWTAGPTEGVRRDVKQEFESVIAALPNRIRVNTRHEVTASRVQGGDLQLDFRRDPRPGEPADGPDGKVAGQATFDLVILAFGFGNEAAQPITGTASASYWSDASVPVAEFQGRATPRFLISGNGDGGLIDLVAAASDHFNHAGMIRQIVDQPGIEGLFDRLEAIDDQARAAFALGQGFDFPAAYDAEIRDDLEALGLIDLVAGRLRPGVKIVLHTLEPELFTIQTATLNRVAAYLVVRACQRPGQQEFRHLHGAGLAATAAPTPPPYAADFWFQRGTDIFGVDAPIIRHGPGRLAARQPFLPLLGDFATIHADWVRLHGEAVRVPELSAAARDALRRAARRASLPMPLYQQRELQAQMPQRIRVQPHGGGLRWSGDLALAAVDGVWGAGARPVKIFAPSAPAALGPLAPVLIRLALHAARACLVVNPADWRAYVDALTTHSSCAEHVTAPPLEAGPPAAAAQNQVDAPASQLADGISRMLNAWVLHAVGEAIQAFTATGRDAAHSVGFRAGADLRVQMAQLWAVWRVQLSGDPGMLDRFLRLVVCADDADFEQDEARVLVGPQKLPAIIRAVAAALAVAAAWPDTAPHAQRPGNLARSVQGAEPKRGHVCAAERIGREPTAIAAVSFIWRTHFVLLSEENTPITLSTQAQVSMASVGEPQPSLADSAGAGGLVLTLDARFRAAAEAGLADLGALLEAVEAQHFARLASAIA